MPEPRFQTLIDMLVFRASKNALRPAFDFSGSFMSFQQLWEELNRFASLLLHSGLKPGERVITAIPNGPEFFIAFYGVQRAGGIPVPLYPDSGPERFFSIAELCGAKTIVIPSSWPEVRFKEIKAKGKKHKKRILTAKDSAPHSYNAPFPVTHPGDIAFIQYTSGSTGNPKGVCLSHHNLMTNMEQMISGMFITEKDIFVSWLPAYHDMGLILMTMIPFYLGAKLFLLPTNLVGMRKWIETIDKQKGTFTAAPDFAYRTVLVYLRDLKKYDLSSLRVALNAAEPVRAETIRNFQKSFNLGSVMAPAYGLAEATVGVSMWPPRTPFKVDQRGFVSFGRGFPGVEMKILHRGKFAGPEVIGEILVKSRANTTGYFKNSVATSKLFWRKDYIHTGDLGYFDSQGDFFIVGRKKNIIIHGGKNISPQEAEEAVDGLPFVRFSAAAGIDRGGVEGEQVYIFAEVRAKSNSSPPEFQNMAAQIVQSFHSRLGFRPGRVYLLKPHSIPRTYNGKIKYPSLKDQYSGGGLRRNNLILFPDY
jgi:acyl-CoA synthetase (AMP-forming)/AMP-acid ligase II